MKAEDIKEGMTAYVFDLEHSTYYGCGVIEYKDYDKNFIIPLKTDNVCDCYIFYKNKLWQTDEFTFSLLNYSKGSRIIMIFGEENAKKLYQGMLNSSFFDYCRELDRFHENF